MIELTDNMVIGIIWCALTMICIVIIYAWIWNINSHRQELENIDAVMEYIEALREATK